MVFEQGGGERGEDTVWAGPLGRVHVRPRGELADVFITLCVLRKQGQVVAARKCDLDPDDRLDPNALRRLGKLHHPAQVVVIRNGEGTHAKRLRLDQQFRGTGSALFERVV